MSQRTIRLNQLLLREFSFRLHSRWRTEAARITLTDASIAPDLHNLVIYYSVIGTKADQDNALRFLRSILNPLKAEVFKCVKIKYTPNVHFAYDISSERGVRLVNVLDQVAREDAARDEAARDNAARKSGDNARIKH